MAAPSEGPQAGPTIPGNWLGRFADRNVKYCSRRLQPRFYTTTHMGALHYWYLNRFWNGGFRDVLEFGCGTQFPLARLLRQYVDHWYATDISEVAAQHVPPGVIYRQCTATTVPFDANSLDAVVIRSVVEHLPDPTVTFREFHRVLRPGAVVFMNVPNKWDYVSVLARLAGRHKSALLKGVSRVSWDDFPVQYRCNTRRDLRRVAGQAGLQVQYLRPLPSEPAYLKFFVPLYLLGTTYQYAISLLALDFLQPAFLAILQKPGES